MTDDEMKKIAVATLANTKIMAGMIASLYSVVDQVVPLLPDNKRVVFLLSKIEQLQSHAADLSKIVETVRKDLGLP